MTDDVLRLLADANPVPDTPRVESPESLRRLIEAEGPPPSAARRRPQARRRAAKAIVALAVAGAAVTTGLALSDGSPQRGLDVAAAAYAAISSGGGVLEAQFLQRDFVPRHRPIVERYREWVDVSAGMRRERRTVRMPGPKGGKEVPVTIEVATSPGWLESWSDAPWERRRGVIQRREYPNSPSSGKRSQGGVSPGEASSMAQGGIEAFRRLYLTGSLRLAGHERLRDRLLWKLESVVPLGVGVTDHRGFKQVYVMVVLVDPSTFLPVLERSFNELAPGRREREPERELLEYRRLPPGSASEALLSLPSQHPGARVVTYRRRR